MSTDLEFVGSAITIYSEAMIGKKACVCPACTFSQMELNHKTPDGTDTNDATWKEI